MEPLVRKRYLLLTMIPQNSTPARLYGQEIFSHLTRQLDGISQYVKSTGTMFVYKKIEHPRAFHPHMQEKQRVTNTKKYLLHMSGCSLPIIPFCLKFWFLGVADCFMV